MAGVAEPVIVIPYAPRPLQRVIHDALDTHRFGVIVTHRRFGKTVLGVNHLQKAALICPRARPRFGYIAPTYTQGKAIAWDFLKFYSAPIPGRAVNESELRIDYPNGGQVRIFGADNPDSLRGLYLDGAVLDEYGLQPPRLFPEVIRPLLVDRQGWALFDGTPNGKNQFYEVVQKAKAEADWFFAEFKASQTGIIPEAELAEARRDMTADQYAQEFECSFEASVKGAVYLRELQQAREDGRVTAVPYDALLPVDTDWDLGIGDQTAIWFSQSTPSGQIRLMDYYEAADRGLDHYAEILRQKGYHYGVHTAPHDIQVRELGTGHSRLEMARQLGLNFRVCPKLPRLEDGIQAVRMILSRCWFDQTKAAKGLEALQHYRWDYNTALHELKPTPVHDFSSHGADAFRTLAVRHYTPTVKAITATVQRDTDPYDKAVSGRAGRRGGY